MDISHAGVEENKPDLRLQKQISCLGSLRYPGGVITVTVGGGVITG